MTDELLRQNNSLLREMINLLKIDKQPVVGKKEAKLILGIDDDKHLYHLVRIGALKKYSFGRDKYEVKQLKDVHEMIKSGAIPLPKKSK